MIQVHFTNEETETQRVSQTHSHLAVLEPGFQPSQPAQPAPPPNN